MKKLVTILGLLLFGVARGQLPTTSPFPNPPAPAIDINQYQFYVDSISPVSLQTLGFAAVDSNTTTNHVINLAGVPAGVHQLYARVVNTAGQPSVLSLGNFFREGSGFDFPNIPPAAININRYNFYIDSVSAMNEQTLGFTATDSNATTNQPISLTGVPAGVHQLYAKVTNTSGHPSIMNLGNFYLEGPGFEFRNVPPVAINIDKYNFYIDSVTALNELTLGFSATDSNSTTNHVISLTGVPDGVHQLYAKVTNTSGHPSIMNIGNFYLEGPGYFFRNTPAVAPNIVRYGFYVDSVTATNQQPLAFTATDSNSTPNFAVDLVGVLPGTHQLYARVFDVNGKQSIVNVRNFTMDQNFVFRNAPTPAPLVSEMEYYVDTDPGYGLATPISFAAADSVTLNNISVNLPPALSIGTHYFHIRSRQNPWSIDNVVPFDNQVNVPVKWLYIRGELRNADARITWGTAQEVNAARFEVEFSTDGVNFTKVGTVTAVGNSNVPNYYQFNHTGTVQGFNYYRIKQLDRNGDFTYSAIVKLLRRDGLLQTLIAPNPVRDVLNVIEPAAVLIKTVSVTDAKGVMVQRKYFNQNIQVFSLPVSNLAAGSYLLVVEYESGSKTYPFIKQ
jgi:hypothetical protein